MHLPNLTFLFEMRNMQVGSGYKIKSSAPGTQTPVVNQRGIEDGPSDTSRPGTSIETVEDAAKIAAYKVSVAENKSFVAAVAVIESERVTNLAEEADMVMQIFREIRDDCKLLILLLLLLLL